MNLSALHICFLQSAAVRAGNPNAEFMSLISFLRTLGTAHVFLFFDVRSMVFPKRRTFVDPTSHHTYSMPLEKEGAFDSFILSVFISGLGPSFIRLN